MLILIFAVELHWLPSSGAYTIGKKNDIGDRILHLILPMSIVVLDHLWYYAYMIRNKIPGGSADGLCAPGQIQGPEPEKDSFRGIVFGM